MQDTENIDFSHADPTAPNFIHQEKEPAPTLDAETRVVRCTPTLAKRQPTGDEQPSPTHCCTSTATSRNSGFNSPDFVKQKTALRECDTKSQSDC